MEGERGINKVDDSISMESIVIDNGVIVEELTNTIEAKLLNDSPLPASCCIFRVPHKIRRKEEQAYEPDIVSIGPFHSVRHGDCGSKFRLMENVKYWYLQCFLSRVHITLVDLIKGVMDLDKRARDCYAEPLNLNKKDFVEMMVLDGCFLIELFQKDYCQSADENDPVFSVSCMREYLYHDLIMLENQLPWFVLKHLYNLTAVRCTTCESQARSLTDLVLHFFRQSEADYELFLNPAVNIPPRVQILHILDLIRTVIVGSFDDFSSQQTEEHEDQQKSKKKQLPQRVPNVTTLSEAGVKFRKSSKTPDCIMNIKFENGVFIVPPLAIDERTGPLFRNLIAFEQCYRLNHKITSYAVLMDNLIDSSKDIDLLSKREILVNWLSPEDAAQFFNGLYNDTTVVNFHYENLCNDVNKYYKTDWNLWMEKLRREYFGTPWAIISLVAAFILLFLTMLQTVYTIQQYYLLPK